MRTATWMAVAVACVGCGGKERAALPGNVPSDATAAPAALANTSRDQFFARGQPTFVLGTAGDDVADHRIATQVGLVRGLALPASGAVADVSIDVAKGPSAWPANPVLYGGPHENAVVAALAPSLPVAMSADEIALGGTAYRGDGLRIVAVIPARAADAAGPGYPEFLWFAGTGPGGIAEINAGLPGGAPILIADAFGGLVAGSWRADERGRVVADMTLAPGRRIGYRAVPRTLASADGAHAATVTFLFPDMLDPRDDDVAIIDACMRGLATVVRKLAIAQPVPLSVYVYPDARSKQQLTGDGGHGHAVPSARALHVLRLGGTDTASIEGLVAHEGTHVLGYYAWGPAGTALMGEGLAVWVSGRYQAHTVDAWKSRLARVPAVADMLGVGWSRIAEPVKYPAAAIVVDAAMKLVGASGVRDHLLGATFETWPAACKSAGTTAEALGAALTTAVSGRTQSRTHD